MAKMNDEERLAFAKYCRVTFRCQGECVEDFRRACPSSWREVDHGVCVAPQGYAGGCGVISTFGLSDEDKHTLGVECGIRWPCSRSLRAECVRNYEAPCPFGWLEKQMGNAIECLAPATYGKCAPVQQF